MQLTRYGQAVFFVFWYAFAADLQAVRGIADVKRPEIHHKDVDNYGLNVTLWAGKKLR